MFTVESKCPKCGGKVIDEFRANRVSFIACPKWAMKKDKKSFRAWIKKFSPVKIKK